jgi:phosphate starvation-inducible PhoH-like protein
LTTTQRAIELGELHDRVLLFGQFDQNLSALERRLSVAIHADGDRLTLAGNNADVDQAERVVRRMLHAAMQGSQLTPDDVALAVADARERSEVRAISETLLRTHHGKEIRPRTEGQRRFIGAIESSPLTIGIGPAGTGKTFLAIVAAVRALKDRKVSRVILSRPAVEAGESLGFLPGDFKEKVDPYMRPLYDALGELLDATVVQKYLDRETIEIAPLAFMRGRTLNDAFVILDEAQNATRDQIKMFLTRLGTASKMVVTGDATQVDLPSGARSGLRDAAERLASVKGVSIVELDETDVVRHPLVTAIIRAYGRENP